MSHSLLALFTLFRNKDTEFLSFLTGQLLFLRARYKNRRMGMQVSRLIVSSNTTPSTPSASICEYLLYFSSASDNQNTPRGNNDDPSNQKRNRKCRMTPLSEVPWLKPHSRSSGAYLRLSAPTRNRSTPLSGDSVPFTSQSSARPLGLPLVRSLASVLLRLRMSSWIGAGGVDQGCLGGVPVARVVDLGKS